MRATTYAVKDVLHERRNPKLGYTWDAQRNYGVIEIRPKDLFSRVEFDVFESGFDKDELARAMGWRFNIDKQVYYRLKGY